MTNETTALTLWEQEMAATAKVQAKAEAIETYTKTIGLRHGILSVDGTAIPGNELDVVVLMAIHENKFYSEDFNPDKLLIPDCYAFGDVHNDENPGAGMVPHDAAKDAQHDNCEECPHNQFGSAAKGRGKACKNIRRLILMDPSDLTGSPKEIEAAEVRSLSLPVTSVKNWGKYMSAVAADTSRPSWGVVTTIRAVPNNKDQFHVVMEFKELVGFTQEMYEALKKKLADLKSNIIQPYVELPEDTKPVQPAGRARQAMQRATPSPIGGKVGKKF